MAEAIEDGNPRQTRVHSVAMGEAVHEIGLVLPDTPGKI
jgi:hypothetical protein